MAAGLALIRATHSPVLLVDLHGDLGCVLGVEGGESGPGSAGVGQWLRADNPPPQSLTRLEVAVVDGLSLLPWSSLPDLSSPSVARAAPSHRAELLARLLAADPRTVIVDLGLRSRPDTELHSHLLTLASRSLLVTRACYLALRSARRWHSPDAVIVIDEAGRPLRNRDISAALGAPVAASVRWDPAVARSIDAGLLTTRLPRPLRPLTAALA